MAWYLVKPRSNLSFTFYPPNYLSSLGFPTKICTIISAMRATCCTHLIPLYLITLIIFGGERCFKSLNCVWGSRHNTRNRESRGAVGVDNYSGTLKAHKDKIHLSLQDTEYPSMTVMGLQETFVRLIKRMSDSQVAARSILNTNRGGENRTTQHMDNITHEQRSLPLGLMCNSYATRHHSFE
jgi:hypothetical protein